MTKVVVILGFLVAFGAGLVIGLNVRREGGARIADKNATTRSGGRGSGGPGGFLAAHLNLTHEQRKQMDKIWSEAVGRGPWEHDKKRRQFRDERDEAIAALVRPEDYDKYDAVLKAYSERLTNLDNQAKAAFEKAVERTKQILTPEQRSKYEAFLRKHPGDRRDRDRGEGERDRGDRDKDKRDKEHGRRPDTRATTHGR